MNRLGRYAVLALILASFVPAAAQDVREALYPSDETRARVCLEYMTHPLPVEDEIQLFQVTAFMDGEQTSATVGVDVIAPIAHLARRCNTNGRVGWGDGVNEMLADPANASDSVWVLVGRHVRTELHAVNHLAALIARGPDGAVTATLFPDPWRSTLVWEYPFPHSSPRHPGRWEIASLFVFDLLEPSFRMAVQAGGSVIVKWKAGELGGEWAWPDTFGDCSGAQLHTCGDVP